MKKMGRSKPAMSTMHLQLKLQPGSKYPWAITLSIVYIYLRRQLTIKVMKPLLFFHDVYIKVEYGGVVVSI